MVELYWPHTAEAYELVADLRDQDQAEMDALGVEDIAGNIEWGIAASDMCWAARVDGKLACIFGVTPTGVVWMLGTPKLLEARRTLLRLTPKYLEQMLQNHPRLYNMVHAENSVAIRWLKAIGFTLHPAIPVAPLGALFHPFEMIRHV